MSRNHFGLPDPVLEAFTMGDCWALAIELSRATGWTIVTATIDVDSWLHVGVRTPSGAVLDIEGAHSPEDWLENWLEGWGGEDHRLMEWPDTERFSLLCARDWLQERLYREHPRVWAERVLASYTVVV